jgi:hypothetical protein
VDDIGIVRDEDELRAARCVVDEVLAVGTPHRVIPIA